MLSLVLSAKRGLGALKKEIKQSGQMSHSERKKDPLSRPSSPQNLRVSKSGMRKV
jgi:hypothetical protein